MRKKLLHLLIITAIFFVSCQPSGTAESTQTDQYDVVQSNGLVNVGFAAFNLTASGFNCDGFLAAAKDLPELHVAFLYNTFGNDYSCLVRMLKNKRLKTLEVNLINEPGHRNGRLGSYEFLAGEGSVNAYDSAIARRDPQLKTKFFSYVKPLQKVLRDNLSQETSLIINPGLESNLSDRSGKILVAWAREAFPTARIVWNPLSPSPSRRVNARADLIEGHNINPNISAPCLYNMDGTDVSYPFRPAIGERYHQEGQTKNWVQSGSPLFQVIEEYANRCEVAFVWTAESNGINERDKNFVDPRKRNHRISNDVYSKIFADIKNLQKTGKVYPSEFKYSAEEKQVEASCTKISSIFADGDKRGNLLKQSEFRDRGGVLLLPSTYSSVRYAEIVRKGMVVDTYVNSGRYKDGRVLFRSNRSPTTYPFKTYLTFTTGREKFCYKIPNPRVRID